jgi:signal transduction histidine kinase
MTEVFAQLLGNSLKFACPGLPPRIVVSGTQEAGMARISVADNGIGIAPPYAEEVFQVFERLHGPGRFPGAGVGLAICRKVVERYGGRIWIDPEPRDGCVVHFTLPMAE